MARAIGAAALLALAGCGASAADGVIAETLELPALRIRARAGHASGRERDAFARWDERRAIARDELVRLAVVRDRGLAADALRVRAMLEDARAEESLPPPELGAEAWNVPLARPYQLGEADMYMVELRQMIPSPGSLGARAQARAQEARAMAADLVVRERAVTRRAADAYADYVGLWLEHGVHEEHAARVAQMVDTARARYPAGGTMLVDVARLDIEMARERRNVTRVRGALGRARAAINALLRRPSRAPLGPPSNLVPATVRHSLEELLVLARNSRAEVTAAVARTRAAMAATEAAEREASTPSFMVGGGYWQDPAERPGFGATVSMTLPWISGAGRARARASALRTRAERAAIDAARAAARGEVGEGHARVLAVEQELAVVRGDVLPAAARAVEAAASAYGSGQGDLTSWLDATRMVLDARMEEAALIAELEHAVAELEQAVGTHLRRAPLRSAPERSTP